MIMIRALMPLHYPFFRQLYKPVDAYLSFFSIYQDWMMFAPNPSMNEIYMYADIEFDDLSKDYFHFSMDEANYWSSKLKKEKIRKLLSSISYNQKNLEELSRFALRKIGSKNFHKIPLKITLYQNEFSTPDIEKKFISYSEKKLSSKSNIIFSKEFFK